MLRFDGWERVTMPYAVLDKGDNCNLFSVDG